MTGFFVSDLISVEFASSNEHACRPNATAAS